ncbi:MAG: pyridoxamine 5'-phosphate oxidase family protein [Caldilineales bacterium]|nr:pyridoxamine 5'-phosphate oxidase family protein [Caldilineales bacterium]
MTENSNFSTDFETFLARPLLARLGTANTETNQPHVTPVWYLWDGGCLWISVYSSTRKGRELLANPRCSVVIDVEDSGLSLKAVLFEGAAELVTGPNDFMRSMFTRIYSRYLGPDGVLAAEPQEWIHSSENLLVKLTPEKTYTW